MLSLWYQDLFDVTLEDKCRKSFQKAEATVPYIQYTHTDTRLHPENLFIGILTAAFPHEMLQGRWITGDGS